MKKSPDLDHVHHVLGAWELGSVRSVTPVTVGNINDTFFVEAAAGRWVLQRLNPIFSAEVHLDIEAVTSHLATKGMTTPRLWRTREAALWTVDQAGGVWRVMSFVDGVNHSRADTPALCREAGRLLGRFHAALADLTWSFKARRLGVHDTPKHLATLRAALASHREHRAYAAAEPLARAILEAAERLPGDAGIPARIVHGDPKLNNIVFSPSGEASCLIDLDTLAVMTIPVELGDAMRSWCNPAGEDAAEAHFGIELFTASLEGWSAGIGSGVLAEVEVAAIVPHVERITIELAARFCADVLNESYFGWNRERFSAAWEHNLLRAQSQWSLARSIAAQRREAERVVRQTLG